MTAPTCRCACGCDYRLSGYAPAEVRCGACLDGCGPTVADLADLADYCTWSGILDLIGQAHRCLQDRDADPVHAADRMRTLGRMLDHAATDVRLQELDRHYRTAVTA